MELYYKLDFKWIKITLLDSEIDKLPEDYTLYNSKGYNVMTYLESNNGKYKFVNSDSKESKEYNDFVSLVYKTNLSDSSCLSIVNSIEVIGKVPNSMNDYYNYISKYVSVSGSISFDSFNRFFISIKANKLDALNISDYLMSFEADHSDVTIKMRNETYHMRDENNKIMQSIANRRSLIASDVVQCFANSLNSLLESEKVKLSIATVNILNSLSNIKNESELRKLSDEAQKVKTSILRGII